VFRSDKNKDMLLYIYIYLYTNVCKSSRCSSTTHWRSAIKQETIEEKIDGEQMFLSQERKQGSGLE